MPIPLVTLQLRSRHSCLQFNKLVNTSPSADSNRGPTLAPVAVHQPPVFIVRSSSAGDNEEFQAFKEFAMRSKTLLMITIATAMFGAPTGGYHVKTKFKIGGEGGWDYATADSDARRLYVSHTNQVEVLDLDSGSVVGKIPDTPG